MTTKKRRGDGKKDKVVQTRSLSELASEMSTRRDKVESLLKDFAILLFGKSLGEVEWDGPDYCRLLYCDRVELTIAIRQNRFAVILKTDQKSSLQKGQLLNSVKELEAFLLKLYDKWDKTKPKPEQKQSKKRK